MPASIGVNLRVTGHCRQGGRKYMEDFFTVAYQQTEDEKDLEFAFFGIYDGHGGAEAAAFAKEHLMESIVNHRGFWSDDDEEVLRSIKDGFINTHLAMWKVYVKWPKTASGLPSTAGTTASIAFIRRGKIYIGHVGDSGITLGFEEPGCSQWLAKSLTKEHKPENEAEMSRIEQSGGKVVSKSGVPRVVWNRPRIGHKGPVRRSTPIDEIPFLAVARSLGDLWSYNSAMDEFVVSPTPDVAVIPIDIKSFRCLIFGTDGLFNMLSPHMAVYIVQQAEKHNEQNALSDKPKKMWVNPSRCLVEKALERWSSTKMRADNTSVITIMLDPPGPPRAQVLRDKKNTPYSSSGLQIETRYQQQHDEEEDEELEEEEHDNLQQASNMTVKLNEDDDDEDDDNDDEIDEEEEVAKSVISSETLILQQQQEGDGDALRTTRESLGYDPRLSPSTTGDIQINEISSSSLVAGVDDFIVDDENQNHTNKTKITRNLRSNRSEIVSMSFTASTTSQVNANNKKIASTFCHAAKKVANSTPEHIPPAISSPALLLTSTPSSSSDCRVLRERKNAPNVVKSVTTTTVTGGLEKRKNSAGGAAGNGGKKMMGMMNRDKKKLIHDILFRGAGANNGKRNNSVSAIDTNTSNTTKNENKAKDLSSLRSKNSNKASTPSLLTTTSSTVVNLRAANNSKLKTSLEAAAATPREVRKSTLAQKLRIQKEIFKAKLRVRPNSNNTMPVVSKLPSGRGAASSVHNKRT